MVMVSHMYSYFKIRHLNVSRRREPRDVGQ